jgi:hypothetical protein
MRASLIHRVIVFVALFMLTTSQNAAAITYGWPDGNLHPNVGAMIRLRSDGVYRILCSGSLIAPTVFLTASHCTSFLEQQGISESAVQPGAVRQRGHRRHRPRQGGEADPGAASDARAAR